MLSSSRNVHPSSHRRVSPLSNDERPYMCVTCASWETSPKLTWTWPSSVYMVGLDLSKSCLHWWCLDETVHFLQWGHLGLTVLCDWDVGTRLQAWPGLCLGNFMPASEHQCSDVWGLGLGRLLWEPCSPLRGLPWPSWRSVLRSGSQSVPCQVHLPGAPGDPQVGYLVIIPISQHIQVE